MTSEIALTLAILLAAVVLFVTEWIRVDLTALLVLVALALTGLVTPAEALAGFSNSAVITVWAVFILSGGLAATGVADFVGRQVFRLSGESETRLLIVLMVTAGLLSAFMNNVGVAALMLPVAVNLARQLRISPSRLLMPMVAATLLGGTITLIGTSPNILASDALAAAGYTPFQFFDFTPLGLALLAGGILFILVIGRRLLPVRSPVEALQNGSGTAAVELYGLNERLATIRLPLDSPLAGHTLGSSRIGRALGLTILGRAAQEGGFTPIEAGTVLAGGDHLLALGLLDRLQEISRTPFFVLEASEVAAVDLFADGLGLAELHVEEGALVGRTISELGLRTRYQINVLAMGRGSKVWRSDLQSLQLQPADVLLVEGDREHLVELVAQGVPGGTLQRVEQAAETALRYDLDDALLAVRLPEDSPLAGRPLSESRLATAYGLAVLAVQRDGERLLMPGPEMEPQAGDVLWLEGLPADLALLRGLQSLEIEAESGPVDIALQSERMGLVEAVLAPRTSLIGKTLRDIHFREKYGVTVLAIWRNGRAYRSNLGEMILQPGDAFLLYGPREKLALLAGEPDFVVLTRDIPAPPHPQKAWLAALIMLSVVVVVLAGVLPIAIAAVTGAALMVLTGCLSMDEAYRSIDWRAVFLIACMLPLGTAMENSGATQLLAGGMVNLVGGWGNLALLAGFFVFANLATQFIPSAVVIVLLAPIAIETAVDLAVSPYSLVMTVAIATSASFMSPVGHPGNVLVMGPGGYRFSDYIRLGLPLTMVTLLIVLLLLPLLWPL